MTNTFVELAQWVWVVWACGAVVWLTVDIILFRGEEDVTL